MRTKADHVLVLLLLWVLSLNVAASFLALSSCSFGLPSSTTPSLAGPGTLQAGCTYSAVLISPAELLSTLPLARQHAYSFVLGHRKGHGTHELNFRPHNVTHIVVGTVFLWFGWVGFNAGSALAANMRAVMATVVTNLAASVGGITWCLLDYRLERKWSTVGFCSGVVAGLVAITPGSGYVPAWAAVVFGVVAGIGCNYATKLKYLINCDDALDIFAVHAVGGFIGNLLTALFAA